MSRRSCYGMRYMIVGAWLSLVPSVTMAAAAARVEFVVGNVSAVSPSGQTRALVKGVDVASGDTVNTHDGRVQLRFTDGAYVSLQPQTLFRIDDYRYDGKSDGNERGFFSLLKGGLRTITGLVGRTNKRNYRVSTTVATIGIRGTEYTLAYTNSVSGSVGEGEIEVCNSGGCLPVASGGSFFVTNSQVRPELTSKKSDLPPSQPAGPTPSFIAGDRTSSNGDLTGLLLTGKHTVNTATTGLFLGVSEQVSAVFDLAGAATQLDLCLSTCGISNGAVTTVTFASRLDEFGNDGVVAWGRGFATPVTGSPVYTHYVSGLPTPLSDLSSLKANNVVATYTFLGGTSPTTANGAVLPTGFITGGSLTAEFGREIFTAVVNLKIADADLMLKSTMKFTQGTSFATVPTGTPMNNIGPNPSTTLDCSMSNDCKMSGFFAGANASRAGLTYQLNTCPGCNGPVNGTAAFVRNP